MRTRALANGRLRVVVRAIRLCRYFVAACHSTVPYFSSLIAPP
jgi:hypothetical protein